MLLAVALFICPLRADPVEPLLSSDLCSVPYDLIVPGGLLGRSGLTVVTDYVDPGNHLRIDLKARSCTITARRPGEDSALAQNKAPALPPKGQIVIKRRADGIAVVYGGVTVARAESPAAAASAWGVVTAAPETLEAIACQPLTAPLFADDFMRGPDEESPWTPLAGDWALSAVGSAAYSANAFHFTGGATDQAPAIAATGDWFWDDYTVEASVCPARGSQGFGIGLCLQDARNYYALRFEYVDETFGRLQLIHQTPRRCSLLAETTASIAPDEWRRLAISAVGDRLTARLGGVEVLAALDPSIAHGRALLMAIGPTLIAFDDVAVHGGPVQPRQPTVLARTSNLPVESFIDDPYMREWSDETDQWLPAGRGLWHTGYFWGDVTLAWQTPGNAIRAPVSLHVCAPDEGEGGYRLDIVAAEGALALSLAKGDRVYDSARVPVPTGPVELAIRKRQSSIEALVNGKPAARLDDPEPLPGGLVGLTGAGVARQSPNLSITSSNVLDTTFRTAPVEWSVGRGDWRVRSRWACTPRWSWFDGRDPDLAAIRTRAAFTGDVIVDCYAGIPMDQPWAPFYQHPGSLAVTLCGHDEGPGYSFVFAGWGNRASGILRGGELVSQTPGVVMPDILDSLGGQALGATAAWQLHNDWWHLRAEKRGADLRFFVNGKPAGEYHDPAPLPGGFVGLWTVQNGLTIARARVYYEDPQPIEPPPPALPGRPFPMADDRAPESGAFSDSFDGPAYSWCPARPGSCVLRTDAHARNGRCLLVVEPSAGGAFDLVAPVQGADLRRHGLLAFECAIPPGVAVDAFAVVNGRTFRLRLAGPDETAPGVEPLAELGVKPDGNWQRARADLADLVAPYFGPADPLTLDTLHFANYSQPEYLYAGIGANAAGASYRLDNVSLSESRNRPPQPVAAEQPSAGDFEDGLDPLRPWGPDAGVELLRTRAGVQGNPAGGEWCVEVRNAKIGGLFGVALGCVPFEASRHPILRFDYRADDTLRLDLVVAVAGTRRCLKFTDNDATWPVIGSLNAVVDGAWHTAEVDLAALLRHAFPGRRSLPVTALGFASSGWPGNRRDTHYGVDNVRLTEAGDPDTDAAPPTVTALSPPPGDHACTRTVSAVLSDEGSGVSPADLRLRVNGRTYSICDRALTFDEATGKVTLLTTEPPGDDGATVSCELTASDLAGNPMPPVTWDWTLRYADDTEPPPAPVASYVPTEALFANDFEADTGLWGNFLSCQALRRDSGGATGSGCLELRDLRDRTGAVFALVADFGEEWKRYHMLRFRYRSEDAPGSSFVLQATTFDGSHEQWTSLASFTAQEEWQTAQVDLAQALAAADPGLIMHRLFLKLSIPVADGALLIDDYAMYAPTGSVARFRWAAPPDPSGIASYSWSLDQAPDTCPSDSVTGAGTETGFTNLKPGSYWFHLRACDGAGNWGPPAHVPFDLRVD